MHESMNWDEVRLFLSVAEEGSFRQAAIKMNVGHTMLSRRIEALEKSLGTKLFTRQSTGLSLTSAGEDMLHTATHMRDQLSDLQARLFGQEQELSGSVRLTAPYIFLNQFLLRELKTFIDQWPAIDFDIDSSTDLVDLKARKADLAIRITSNPGDYYIGRPLGSFCEAVYASPEYLDKFRKEAFSRHRWIYPGGDYEFVAELHAEWSTQAQPEPHIVLPDVYGQREAAELGMGIATLPCVMVGNNPKLQQISAPYERYKIWLLAHPDTRGNKRMQLCRQFFVEVFERQRENLEGTA